MNIIQRLKEYCGEHGFGYTLSRSADKAAQVLLGTYDRVWRLDCPSPEELERQRACPPDAGLISVVIPVYNTRVPWLNALLESLRAQTYGNWEAILYDGHSTDRSTFDALEQAAREEPRFRLIHGPENLGISGNTNAAIALAKGEYIALCDHDDLLRADALWRMAEAIARDHPAWLYSDEDMVTQNGKRHIDPHYKPDFCPEYLIGDNYISHLCVLRKSLLEQVGGLRSGFDGSQDHDLYLRCAAVSGKALHVPFTLYSWRKARNSVSRQHLDRCLDAAARAAESEALSEGRQRTAIPIGRRLRIWDDFPRNASVEVILFGSDEEGCRECFADLEAVAPWPRLTATLVVTDLENLYAALNEAAAASAADYLLFLDAASAVQTRHFFRELLMYARKDGVAGVTPVLIDRKNRITHAGFALGMNGVAQPVNAGLKSTAGGWHDLMNKVHNVSAISVCCMMVRRDQFLPFDERYRSGLGSAEQGLRAISRGMRFVFTPHASLLCEDPDLLLLGRHRFAPDVALFEQDHGTTIYDPCYPARLSRKKANYSL